MRVQQARGPTVARVYISTGQPNRIFSICVLFVLLIFNWQAIKNNNKNIKTLHSHLMITVRRIFPTLGKSGPLCKKFVHPSLSVYTHRDVYYEGNDESCLLFFNYSWDVIKPIMMRRMDCYFPPSGPELVCRSGPDRAWHFCIVRQHVVLPALKSLNPNTLVTFRSVSQSPHLTLHVSSNICRVSFHQQLSFLLSISFSLSRASPFILNLVFLSFSFFCSPALSII